MFNREIFRKSAMEKLSTPDDLDELLRVNSNFSWILLISMLCVVFGGAVWGFFGKIVNRVTMTGAMVQSNPPRPLLALETGQADSVFFFAGDKVSKGQAIATYFTEGNGAKKSIESPESGELIELNLRKGDLLSPGKVVAKIQQVEPEGASQQEFIFFVSDRLVDRLAVGQPVTILVKGRKSESVQLNSKIKYLSKIPASADAIKGFIPNKTVAEQMINGNFFLVRTENIGLPSGNNQTADLSSADLNGKIITGEAIVSQESPVSYLLSPSR